LDSSLRDGRAGMQRRRYSLLQYRRLLVRAILPSVAASLLVACDRTSTPEAFVAARAASIACSPATADATQLANEWRPFAGFIDICRVEAPGGEHALSIRTVSAHRYYASVSAGAETKSFPPPLLLSPANAEVGHLPYSYPDDPPFAIELTFADWEGNRPNTISILVRDPTVSGDHALTPLRWDAASGRYAGAREQ